MATISAGQLTTGTDESATTTLITHCATLVDLSVAEHEMDVVPRGNVVLDSGRLQMTDTLPSTASIAVGAVQTSCLFGKRGGAIYI